MQGSGATATINLGTLYVRMYGVFPLEADPGDLSRHQDTNEQEGAQFATNFACCGDCAALPYQNKVKSVLSSGGR